VPSSEALKESGQPFGFHFDRATAASKLTGHAH
jgi:hypothetical protein